MNRHLLIMLLNIAGVIVVARGANQFFGMCEILTSVSFQNLRRL
jgi:hypothetical protein